MRFRIEKFQVLSDFKTKFLQLVRFQINFLTTRQILKQKFHNMSDFESKTYNVSDFVLQKFFWNQILNKNMQSKNHVLLKFTP